MVLEPSWNGGQPQMMREAARYGTTMGRPNQCRNGQQSLCFLSLFPIRWVTPAGPFRAQYRARRSAALVNGHFLNVLVREATAEPSPHDGNHHGRGGVVTNEAPTFACCCAAANGGTLIEALCVEGPCYGWNSAPEGSDRIVSPIDLPGFL
jgi:hypothetical protein